MIISHPPTPHLSKYHTDQSRSTPIDSNASSDHQSFNKFFWWFSHPPTHSLTHIFEVQRSGRSSKDWLEWLKGAARSSRFFCWLATFNQSFPQSLCKHSKLVEEEAGGWWWWWWGWWCKPPWSGWKDRWYYVNLPALAPGVQSSPVTASNVRNCHSFGCKNIVRDGFRGLLAWCSQTRLQPREQIIKEYKMVL